jgi:hypothetical protein
MFSPPGDYTSQLILPMSLAEIMAETLRIYRKSFLTFFMIALLTALPGLILTLILNASPLAGEYVTAILAWSEQLEKTPLGSTAGPPSFAPGAASALLRYAILSLGVVLMDSFVFRSMAIGATTLGVAEANASQRATVSGALQALRHTGTLLSWGFVVGGLVLGPIFLAAFLVLGSGAAEGGAICIIVLLLLVSLFACFVLGRLLFGARAIVAENMGVAAAWRRSWNLTSTNYWRVFGIGVLVVVGIWLVGWLLNHALSPLLPPTTPTEMALGSALLNIVTTILGALLAPIVYISLTLLYYDERRTQELPAVGSGPTVGL